MLRRPGSRRPAAVRRSTAAPAKPERPAPRAAFPQSIDPMRRETMGNKLYVGNLPYDVNEEDLTDLFAKAGKVSTVSVVRDRETGRGRGFAFVEMATDQDAQNAIAQLHQQSFGGRALAVNEARPMTP